MAGRPHAGLRARAEVSGRTFSIIFAVIALLIAIACVTWAIVLPRLKRRQCIWKLPWKHRTNNASTTQDIPRYYSRQRFPSHPAIMRRFDHYQPRQPKPYSSRTPTPFPSNDINDSYISLQSMNTRRTSATIVQSSIESSGLFSPSKNKSQITKEKSVNSNLMSPANPEALQLKQYIPDKNMDGIEPYSLPIPEPLILKARSAGRPPPLTKQLEKFPRPAVSWNRMAKSPHPRKLFEELERGCSTNMDALIDTPTPTAISKGNVINHDASLPIAAEEISFHASQKSDKREVGQLPRPLVRARKQGDVPDEAECDRVPTMTLGRRRAYSTLNRAGTTTRPKTPVMEMCDLYDRSASTGGKYDHTLIKLRNNTGFSELIKNSTESIEITASTAPSSSPFITEKSLSATSAITTRPSTGSNGIIKDVSNAKHLPSPGTERIANKRLAGKRVIRRKMALNRIRNSKLLQHSAYHDFRAPRPAWKAQRWNDRHSISSFGSSFLPFLQVKRQSLRASSRYSRDTKGISFIKSPVSSEFERTATLDQLEGPQPVTEQPRTSSLELLKIKVDDWHLDTAGVNLIDAAPPVIQNIVPDRHHKSSRLDSYCRHSAPQLEESFNPNKGTAQVDVGVRRVLLDPARETFSQHVRGIAGGNRTLTQSEGEVKNISDLDLPVAAGYGCAPGGAQWI